MTKRYKVNACLIVALTIVFYVFWELCKQLPALARVATFTEDPYDAIAAVPFAIFLALLAVVRAFRPYASEERQRGQRVLLVRGAYLSCLAVAVTLGADVVAMLRYPSVWIGSSAGFVLVLLVGGMALLTFFVGWRVSATTHEDIGASRRRGWLRAIGISLVGVGICCLYPQNWQQGFPTKGWASVFSLFTIGVGMMIQYTSIWAWGRVISPQNGSPQEDLFDDLAALFRGFKQRAGRLAVLFVPLEKSLRWFLSQPAANWLNPRKGRWFIVVALFGILVGIILAFSEALGLGHPFPPPGLLRIFVGVQCVAALLGYAFFAGLLELARREAPDGTPIKG